MTWTVSWVEKGENSWNDKVRAKQFDNWEEAESLVDELVKELSNVNVIVSGRFEGI